MLQYAPAATAGATIIVAMNAKLVVMMFVTNVIANIAIQLTK